MNYRIFPPEEMIETTVKLPLSKSIVNRLLIINALGGNVEFPQGSIDCEDTKLILNALQSNDGRFDLGLSGAAMRFLTAYFSTLEGRTVILDGNHRLRERPMKPLIEALRQIGAQIKCLEEEGFAPIRIVGKKLTGGDISLDATVSSQFVSALMLIAPCLANGLTINLEGEPVSLSYIKMTAELMEKNGAQLDVDRQQIKINHGEYQLNEIIIERDWSAASYWYEIVALSAGFVTLEDLSARSIQGDSACIKLFEMLGVNTEPSEEGDGLDLMASPEQFSRFETDLSDTPDLAPTLAVTSALLGIPFHLTGLSTLEGKESNRLTVLKEELLKFGIICEIRGGSQIVWNGERVPIIEVPRISPHGDHRIAMAFAPTSLYVPGVVIEDAESVAKSYPEFFNDLRKAGFAVEEYSEEENAEKGGGD